ncbi:MAG: hypothetical protein HRU34_00300 [Richelia sp.]|nr:hypothetical protein [Richelia sp.]
MQIRKNRLSPNRILLHPDILNERHTQAELAEIVPMQQFMDADYFLFLRSEFQAPTASQWDQWIPWSKVYMNQTPRYLLKAERIQYAQELLFPLGIDNINDFRLALVQAIEKFDKMFTNGFPNHLFRTFDPKTIGSR